MTRQGWIRLYRGIEENFLHPTNTLRKFTEYEAVIDILMSVAHQDTEMLFGNEVIKIPQDCFCATRVYLAQRWKWDRRRVSSFLNLLREQRLISFYRLNHKRLKSWTLFKVNKQKLYGDEYEPETSQ